MEIEVHLDVMHSLLHNGITTWRFSGPLVPALRDSSWIPLE